jgi:BON domain-containing protein
MSGPDDPYLAERVRRVLAQDPRVNELGLVVDIAEGRATVSGAVASAERRQAIVTVMHEQFPELELANDVTVHRIATRPTRETLS